MKQYLWWTILFFDLIPLTVEFSIWLTWRKENTYKQLSLLRNGDGELPFSSCLFHTITIWIIIILWLRNIPERSKWIVKRISGSYCTHCSLPCPKQEKIWFLLSLLASIWIFLNEIYSVYSVRIHLFKMTGSTVKDGPEPGPDYPKFCGKGGGWR